MRKITTALTAVSHADFAACGLDQLATGVSADQLGGSWRRVDGQAGAFATVTEVTKLALVSGMGTHAAYAKRTALVNVTAPTGGSAPMSTHAASGVKRHMIKNGTKGSSPWRCPV